MDFRKEMIPSNNPHGADYYFSGRLLDYTGDCLRHISCVPTNLPYAVCQCSTGLTFRYTTRTISPARIIPNFSFSDGLLNGIKLLSNKNVPINTLKLNSKQELHELLQGLTRTNKSKHVIIGPFLSSQFESEFLTEYEIYPSQYLICTSFINDTGIFFHPDGMLFILSYDDLLGLLNFTNNNIDNLVALPNKQTEAIHCSINNVSLKVLIFGGSILANKEVSQQLEILNKFFKITNKVSDLIAFNYDLSRIILDLLCVKETGEYAILSDSIDIITIANVKNVLKCANVLINNLSIISVESLFNIPKIQHKIPCMFA
jgi:hypothetical protein